VNMQVQQKLWPQVVRYASRTTCVIAISFRARVRRMHARSPHAPARLQAHGAPRGVHAATRDHGATQGRRQPQACARGALACGTPLRCAAAAPQLPAAHPCRLLQRCWALLRRERRERLICECSEQPGEPRPPSGPFVHATPVRDGRRRVRGHRCARHQRREGDRHRQRPWPRCRRRVQGARTQSAWLLQRASGSGAPRVRQPLPCANTTAAHRLRGSAPRSASARASATLTQRARNARVAGVALEQPPQGRAVLCGPEQGEGLQLSGVLSFVPKVDTRPPPKVLSGGRGGRARDTGGCCAGTTTAATELHAAPLTSCAASSI
jgi:hypothetical protein